MIYDTKINYLEKADKKAIECLHILSFLPSTEVKHRANADRDALFEIMGNQFTRAQLLEQAEKMKIKPNTALSWLNRLIKKGLLINTDDKGVYTRTHVCVC